MAAGRVESGEALLEDGDVVCGALAVACHRLAPLPPPEGDRDLALAMGSQNR